MEYFVFRNETIQKLKFSGVARRRKVGGGQTFFPKSEKQKKKKKKKGHSGVKAQDRVLWIGEGLII